MARNYFLICANIFIQWYFLINRARYHKLKYGTDLVMQGDIKPPLYEEGTCNTSEGGGSGSNEGGNGGGGGGDGEASFTSVSNVSWRQGRQLLRQYVKHLIYVLMFYIVRIFKF